MSATTCFVGIDVAKAQLDMALRPTGERWAVAHDEAGIAALVARRQALLPTLMVLDATGATSGPWWRRWPRHGCPWRW
jgi:transposase